ncbi:MAG: PAS domain S-box protein [Desulfomonilaceae bacterium]
MQSLDKTKEQLIDELKEMRNTVSLMEATEARLRGTEKALRESEERFRLLYENAPLGYQSLDENGYLLEVNQAWLDMLGYSRKEVMGKWVGDFLAPDYVDRLKENFPKFKAAGEIHGAEFVMLRKDGSRITVLVDGRIGYTEQREFKQTHCILHDITERKLAEEAKARIDKIYRQMFEGSHAVKLLIDPESAELIDANPAAADFYGYTVDDLKRMKISDISIHALEQIFAEMRKAKTPNGLHGFFKHRLASGETRDVEVHSSPLDVGDKRFLYSIIHDITERKQAEEAVDRANKDWELTFNSISDIVMVLDDQHKILRANKAMADALGMTEQDLVGKFCFELVHGEKEPPVCCPHSQLLADGEAHSAEVVEPRLGGTYDVGVSPLTDQAGHVIGCIHVARDITERKRADEILRRSEAKFIDLYENAPCAYFSVGPDAIIRLCNRRAGELLGYSRKELIGKPVFDLYADKPEGKEKAGKLFKRFIAGEPIADEELQMQKADGTPVWISLTVNGIRDSNGHVVESRSMVIDISDRKRAEEALRRLNRELKAISNCNQILLRAVDEQTLVDDICRIICDEAGYRLAWVGFAENDVAKTVRPVAWAGFDSGYIANAKLTWADDTERGRGPAGKAIRSGETIYVQDFATDSQMAPWRESGLQRGYRSGIALPLKDESAKVFGVLLIYHAEPDAMTPNEIQLMEELAGDLAFGIVVLRSRIDRKRAEKALRESEAKLVDAARIANVGYWDHDYVAESITLSDEACRIFGLPQHFRFPKLPEWHAQWIKLVHPEDQPKAAQALADALAGGPRYNVEYRVVRPDGEVRDIYSHGDVTRDESGKPIRVFGTMIDITERKRREQERLANLNFFESMDKVNRAIQGARDVDSMMSDVLDVVLSIFDCDRAWLFYPCDPDAPSFRVPMEVTKPEYPGAKILTVDLPMPPDMAQDLREALESVGPVTYTAGTEKPINKVSADQFGVKSMMMVALYPKSGKPWAFGLHQCSYPRVWTSEEERLFQETGRRLADGLTSLLSHRGLEESEAKYRRIVETATEGIWVLGPDTMTTFVNVRMAEMLGYSGEEMIGRAVTDFMFDADAPDHLRRMENCHQRLSENYERRFRRKDGRTVWTLVSATPIFDDDHRFNGLFGMFTDITERKRAEEVLRESEERFSKAFRYAPALMTISNVEDGRYVDVNNEFCRVSGFTREELVGRTSIELGWISPQDRLRLVEQLELHGRLEEMELNLTAKDKRQVYCVYRGEIVQFHNRPYLLSIVQDITERKKADEVLRRHNEFLTTVLGSLTHPFYVINADNHLIELANAAALSSGVSASSTCYGATHGREIPCNDSAHPCPLDEVKRTGQPARVEHVHHDKEGKPRNIEVHAYPVLDDTGKVVQVIEYCLDVTDLKQAENSRRQQERMLNTILETSPSGIAYFQERKILWWNSAMRELFGYDEDDSEAIKVRSLHEFYESRAEYERVVEIFLAQNAEGRRLETTARFRRKDGSIFIGNVSVGPTKLVGPEDGTTVIIRDITARKAIEEERMRLMTAIEQAAETIVITDQDGTIRYVNPAFEKLTEYTAPEAVGQNPRILKSGKHDHEFYKDMWETLLRGEAWKGHLVDKKKDGKLFEEEATISPVKDELGNIVNYVAVKHDVTDQVSLEKQLRQAQKMEAIGTLAGGIAHDFNNLLQVVLGYADILMMQRGTRSPDFEKLETIRKAAKDGGELVKGLLTFSRQVESNLRPCDLNLELKRIERMLARTIPKMIRIDLILADDAKTVNGDPVQIEQVVLNLCVNAHHAMPQGGMLTIETKSATLDKDYCRTHLDARQGDYTLLKITDTGHGMERKVLERIFEPFYTTKETGEGTGLGLAIVYGIVKNHGGHITCQSEPGQGSTFNIYFPSLPVGSEMDMATMSGEMPAFGTETILVVDDEQNVRNIIEHLLTGRGYKVFQAESGEKALGIYQEKKEEIDLVLLDLNMPGMGGAECLNAILKIDPKARVLIATGFSSNQSKKRIMENGAIEFVAKPFEAKDLLRAIRRVLEEPGFGGSQVSGSGPASVGSAEGKGTPAATPPPVEASPVDKSPDITKLTRKLRILAIDDREPYLRILEAGLAQFGQTPFTASSGIEGLQVFQETPVDLVICDLEMPELDGWAVSKRIKEICREKRIPKTPFVLLTGEAEREDIDQEDTEKMADCGVDAILGKPVDIPEILAVAGRLIAKMEDRAE